MDKESFFSKGKAFFKIIFSLFFLNLLFLFSSCQSLSKLKPYIQEEENFHTMSLEIPVCPATQYSGIEEHEDHEVHTYNGFQLCYRESYEQAEWVSYTITRAELVKVTGRTNDFRPDTQISTGSAELSDYKGSGFDRGHLAPSADMTWSKESASDSFLLSNMSPQRPAFNRKMWKTLEESVRSWADYFGHVVVITGPLLEKDSSQYETIGANKVSVPEFYYKALLTSVTVQGREKYIALAFIMPNENIKGSIWDFACNVDQVEKRSGLDFFSLLLDFEEKIVESSNDFSLWKEALEMEKHH